MGVLAGNGVALYIQIAVAGEGLLIYIGYVLYRRCGSDDLEDRTGSKGGRNDVVEIYAVIFALVILVYLGGILGIVARGAGIAQYLARLVVVYHTSSLVTA